jgi:hypothetical protein
MTLVIEQFEGINSKFIKPVLWLLQGLQNVPGAEGSNLNFHINNPLFEVGSGYNRFMTVSCVLRI